MSTYDRSTLKKMFARLETDYKIRDQRFVTIS